MPLHKEWLLSSKTGDLMGDPSLRDGVTLSPSPVLAGSLIRRPTLLGHPRKPNIQVIQYLRIMFLCSQPHGVEDVDTKKKRLTLDLDPPLQRRLKAIAALKIWCHV